MTVEFITGNDGSVTFPSTWGSATKLSTWSASFSRVSTNISGFGDATHRRRLGVIDVTGSAAGHLARDAASAKPGEDLLDGANLAGASITLTVSPDPDSVGAELACSYTFIAVCDAMQISTDKNGDQTVSFNFQLAGGAAPVVLWHV